MRSYTRVEWIGSLKSRKYGKRSPVRRLRAAFYLGERDNKQSAGEMEAH